MRTFFKQKIYRNTLPNKAISCTLQEIWSVSKSALNILLALFLLIFFFFFCCYYEIELNPWVLLSNIVVAACYWAMVTAILIAEQASFTLYIHGFNPVTLWGIFPSNFQLLLPSGLKLWVKPQCKFLRIFWKKKNDILDMIE